MIRKHSRPSYREDRGDPVRRLLAAVVLNAVKDCAPERRVAPDDRASAEAFLAGEEAQKQYVKTIKQTATEAGTFLSKRERIAVDAEREMVDRLKVRFMADKEGESFNGIVSGVTSFGLFIELLECFVSGAVAITDLKDDYYHHDEKGHRLVGKGTNKIYRIGDLVRVRVAHVEVRRRRINFVIDE